MKIIINGTGDTNYGAQLMKYAILNFLIEKFKIFEVTIYNNNTKKNESYYQMPNINNVYFSKYRNFLLGVTNKLKAQKYLDLNCKQKH